VAILLKKTKDAKVIMIAVLIFHFVRYKLKHVLIVLLIQIAHQINQFVMNICVEKDVLMINSAIIFHIIYVIFKINYVYLDVQVIVNVQKITHTFVFRTHV